MKQPAVLFGIALVIALSGCRQHIGPPGTKVQRQGQPDVHSVSDTDPEMNKAIESARQTVNQFITHLKSPGPNENSFAVKRKFESDGNVEHMWLSDVTFDGKMFHGTVGNDPVDIKGVRLGDAATVAPNEISDWMYLDGRRLVGGYSVRLLYFRSTHDERKKMDAEGGMIIEPDPH